MNLRLVLITLAGSLAVTAVMAAETAPGPAANADAFTRQCTAKGPADICACMADELQRGRDGQVVLETYAIAELPEADRAAAKAAMMERYKLTPAELAPIGNAVPTLLDTALKACDPE
jgi:hypothetical protein